MKHRGQSAKKKKYPKIVKLLKNEMRTSDQRIFTLLMLTLLRRSYISQFVSQRIAYDVESLGL